MCVCVCVFFRVGLQQKRAGVKLSEQAYHDDMHYKGRISYRHEQCPISKTTNRKEHPGHDYEGQAVATRGVRQACRRAIGKLVRRNACSRSHALYKRLVVSEETRRSLN